MTRLGRTRDLGGDVVRPAGVISLGAVLVAALGSGCATPPAEQDGAGRAAVGAGETGEVTTGGALRVLHDNRFPARIAQGGEGQPIYVSDPEAGSVFVYSDALALQGELKGLERPLGLAVGAGGEIYVGNDGRDNVEVYGPDGFKRRVIPDITMPNDLALDQSGNLYVVDSLRDLVKVYSPAGAWLRDLGGVEGANDSLDFPVAVAVAARPSGEEEIFVADQGHATIKVYDLQGALVRELGGPVQAFIGEWKGRFSRPQDLAVDAEGRLHVLDVYQHHVQVIDPDSGAFLGVYGEFGTGRGELRTPLDLLLRTGGDAVIANSGNHRLELVVEVKP